MEPSRTRSGAGAERVPRSCGVDPPLIDTLAGGLVPLVLRALTLPCDVEAYALTALTFLDKRDLGSIHLRPRPTPWQQPAARGVGERGTGPARLDESALMNYRVRLPYYVVDRLFETALLIVGVGRQQDRVTIRRKAEDQ